MYYNLNFSHISVISFRILLARNYLFKKDLFSYWKVRHYFFLRFIFINFYWKGGYTERRDREEDLPSDDSLPK